MFPRSRIHTTWATPVHTYTLFYTIGYKVFIYGSTKKINKCHRSHSEQLGVSEFRTAPAAILRLELVERSLKLLEEVLLFRKDGEVDRARAGRGGGPVLMSIDLRLQIRVDLDLHRCAC